MEINALGARTKDLVRAQKVNRNLDPFGFGTKGNNLLDLSS